MYPCQNKNVTNEAWVKPLLLHEQLNKYIQDYLNNLREIEGVVNTTVIIIDVY